MSPQLWSIKNLTGSRSSDARTVLQDGNRAMALGRGHMRLIGYYTASLLWSLYNPLTYAGDPGWISHRRPLRA